MPKNIVTKRIEYDKQEVKEAAQKLFLHPQTLLARMRKNDITLEEAVAMGGTMKKKRTKPDRPIHPNGSTQISFSDYESRDTPKEVKVSKKKAAARRKLHELTDRIEEKQLEEYLELA